MQVLKSIRNAVRRAVGLPPVADRPKLLEIPTALQRRMAPYARYPQWFRLLMLYRITKRNYSKRRLGMSAKSPEVAAHHRRRRADGLPCSKMRLASATGPNSYDEWKAQCAAARAQRRVLVP
jgi:hypothetical protein